MVIYTSHVHFSGQFKVKWIYVKDVPNNQVSLLSESLNGYFTKYSTLCPEFEFEHLQLRHIKLENNENKPVTNSRDTQVFNLIFVSKKISKKV